MIYRRYQIFTRVCHPGGNRRPWRLRTMRRLAGPLLSRTHRDRFGTTCTMPDGAEMDGPSVNLRSSASLFDWKFYKHKMERFHTVLPHYQLVPDFNTPQWGPRSLLFLHPPPLDRFRACSLPHTRLHVLSLVPKAILLFFTLR